ncbi:hypothetical protein ACMHYO_11355 [Allopusillimonas ginsengisoli]|uniref:hypothetical protein n=1 Tax=Allopusillimonas ginsengisoli TaxID=453575 RepID=UPI0039C295C9
MIFRMLTGAVMLVVVAYWSGSVLIERDRCEQIKEATAPVRLAFDIARAADKNFAFVADYLTWISWRQAADEWARAFLVKAIYGTSLTCNSPPENAQKNPAIVPDGSTEFEFDLGAES